MKAEIITTIKNLGFTEYEAKAYLALLEKSPLTGYGVALNSGVPRSKIYEVLDGLVQNGEVIISYGAPVLYAPLSPKELIAHRQNKTEENFNLAFAALEHFSTSEDTRDNIWNISGREQIINKAKELIKNSKEEILLELWQEDLVDLISALKDALKRGVSVILVAHGDIDLQGAQMFKFPLDQQVLENQEQRCLAICMDKKEALQGIVSLKTESLASSSMHPGLVIPVYKGIKRSILVAEV